MTEGLSWNTVIGLTGAAVLAGMVLLVSLVALFLLGRHPTSPMRRPRYLMLLPLLLIGGFLFSVVFVPMLIVRVPRDRVTVSREAEIQLGETAVPRMLISTSQTGGAAESRSAVSSGKKAPARGIAVNVEIPEGASEESRAKAANLLQALSRAVSETVQDDLRKRFEAARKQTVETLALVADVKTRKPAVPRPDWVESPAHWVEQTYQMPITIGPYATRPECDARTPEGLARAVNDYVALVLNPEIELKPDLPTDYLEENVVKQRFEETIQSSVGPMIQRHLLLEFDRSVRDRLEKLLSAAVVYRRLLRMGIGFGCLLALLAIAWAGLRISLVRSKPTTPNS